MHDLQPAPAEAGPPAVPPVRPASHAGWRRRLRSLLVGAVSLVVLLAGAVYVLAPEGVDLRLSATELRGAQPFDHDTVPQYTLASSREPARTTYTETVYGSISARGVPISRPTLVITSAERATRGRGAIVRLPTTGTYRVVLHLLPGRYTFRVTVRVRGVVHSVAKVVTLRNRAYYRISIRVSTRSVVTFLPVTTY